MITGASGFVGVNLTRYFTEQNYIAHGLSLRSGLPDSIPAETDSIIHLAGKAHDLKNISDPSEYFNINTFLTHQLYDLFLLSDASVFIFMSSVKASADSVENMLTEDSQPNPVTVYGQSKLKAEQYLLSQILPEGKRLFILRPCMIHGPGNKGNLNLLYQLVKKRMPYPLAAFDNKRSFLSVGNLCYVIKEFIEREDIPSGIYNVADDLPLSTKEVMQNMGEVLRTRPVFLKFSKNLIKRIAVIGDKIPIALNTYRLKKLTENYIVSTDKLKKVLQKPLPISSTEGLKISVRSFLGEA